MKVKDAQYAVERKTRRDMEEPSLKYGSGNLLSRHSAGAGRGQKKITSQRSPT